MPSDGCKTCEMNIMFFVIYKMEKQDRQDFQFKKI